VSRSVTFEKEMVYMYVGWTVGKADSAGIGEEPYRREKRIAKYK
jgi:hypothetical protein